MSREVINEGRQHPILYVHSCFFKYNLKIKRVSIKSLKNPVNCYFMEKMIPNRFSKGFIIIILSGY